MLILKIALAALGGSAVLIGSSMFLFGSAATGNFFGGLLSVTTGLGGPVGDLSAPNVDSELRFYAVFWIAYGVIALRIAGRLPDQLRTAQLLLALFFCGGLGRLLSALTVGWPDPLFIVLMWIELLLPLFLFGLSVILDRQRRSER